MVFFILFFCFASRRRHTRCYRDWSSDVCSSDLLQTVAGIHAFSTAANFFFARYEQEDALDRLLGRLMEQNILIRDCRNIEGLNGPYFQIGRASCRERAEISEVAV